MLFMRKSKYKKQFALAFGGLMAFGILVLGVTIATDPGDNLVVRDVRFIGGGIERVIAGTVENNTDRQYSDVAVYVDLLNDEGVLIGTTTARIEALPGGERWQFAASVRGAVDASSFKTRVFSPDIARPFWFGGF